MVQDNETYQVSAQYEAVYQFGTVQYGMPGMANLGQHHPQSEKNLLHPFMVPKVLFYVLTIRKKLKGNSLQLNVA